MLGHRMVTDGLVGLGYNVTGFLSAELRSVTFSGLLWNFSYYTCVWTKSIDLIWVQFDIIVSRG